MNTLDHSQKRSPIAIFFLLVVFLFFSIQIIIMFNRLQMLERRVLMLRSLAPLRTREQIITILGKPDNIINKVAVNGEKYELMIYKSSPKRINSFEDIWLAIDEKESVQNVYYPDNPQEKHVIDSSYLP